MERILALETIKKVGGKVRLCGWVNSRRDHGKLVFIDLRDRSGVVQLVITPLNSADSPTRRVEDFKPDGFSSAESSIVKLRPEDVIEVIGTVKKRTPGTVNPKIPTGTVEIQVEKIKILAKAEPLPFDTGKEELSLELTTLLDNRSLALRHPKVRAIFKIQETIIQSFRETLKELDFTEFAAPTIVPVATEGGAEIFPVKYYDYTAYLGQSPQLYKQIMVSVFERVFTVTKAYRAEPSMTTRHLSEYISLDAEMGFIDSWDELLDTAELVMKKIFLDIEKKNKRELDLFAVKIPSFGKRIPKLKMREAQEIIYKRTGRDNRKEPDLEPKDEKEICKWSKEKFGSDLVFITHYPTKKRPFYTFPDPQDSEYTLSFDLLGKGLELVTGGQRINDYQQLLEHIKKWGNKPQDFEIYLQAFKYGMPPEGGFALGAERITKQVLGLKSVKEASLFPRDMERVDVRLSTLYP